MQLPHRKESNVSRTANFKSLPPPRHPRPVWLHHFSARDNGLDYCRALPGGKIASFVKQNVPSARVWFSHMFCFIMQFSRF
jgi:hypothetical protein